ncbi:putative acyl-activating enzyme chloroplastic-like [Trifolium pratense]|uniref:Putative acyl-activating enzyme chloroplastic-like n=1 Tax=Trifolium pratense TaxID=57577 RepID=A0A2K3LXL9_TRIPR|nr:putative acyl-activating enzyme chloroplastic-like [Trifolium pratense]
MSTIHAFPLFFTTITLPRNNFVPPRFRVFSQSKTADTVQIRKCSPFLESSLLFGNDNDAVASNEWKAVPDIWKYSAEKYGDKVALVDPYHDPPSTITYKQLEQAILDFAEGLRVIGVRPDEKLALFADNSCRWLVADQGVLIFCSVFSSRN